MKLLPETQIIELPNVKASDKESTEVLWEKKSGRAPAGAQERELQKFLDHLLE